MGSSSSSSILYPPSWNTSRLTVNSQLNPPAVVFCWDKLGLLAPVIVLKWRALLLALELLLLELSALVLYWSCP